MKNLKRIIIIILIIIATILTPYIFKDNYRELSETLTTQCLYGCPTSKKVKKINLNKYKLKKF